MRDFVPAIVGAAGGVLDVRGALDDDEFMRALDAKLVEEALEVGATAGQEEAPGELADLLRWTWRTCSDDTRLSRSALLGQSGAGRRLETEPSKARSVRNRSA
ncbi:hypothetical protein [Rathayibacter rathayi]|uniref:hypothetical protein n=1 Tax=Rathayibacter rathayi TaxID=33887 RepID=UPI0011AFD8AB|nr:hypothetical protein [Rathayibacter rathayi]